MLQNTSDWKEIFESIMYLFGDNLDLHVEFWEKVADGINSMISTELVEWLSRLQLLLPLELGQRLYHAKVRLINKKFEINTMYNIEIFWGKNLTPPPPKKKFKISSIIFRVAKKAQTAPIKLKRSF